MLRHRAATVLGAARATITVIALAFVGWAAPLHAQGPDEESPADEYIDEEWLDEPWPDDDDDDDEPLFSATAVVRRRPTAHRRIDGAAARDLPGSFGDPFRIVDALPGAVPMYTGVPYVFVRGAPPSGTRYHFDGVPLPQLFHAALGPAVIHPRLIGGMDYHAGVAPARYGGHLGAVVVADLAEGADRRGGEIDVRLIDAAAFVDRPLPGGGRLTLAGRFGYPQTVLFAISPDTRVWYGDYQARLQVPLSSRLRAELLAIGAYDDVTGGLGVTGDFGIGLGLPSDLNARLTFHRLDVRLVRRLDRGEVGAALRLGYDLSTIGNELRVDATQVAPRLWWETLPHRAIKLRFGAEMAGWVGSLANDRSVTGGIIHLPATAREPTRSTSSAYVEGRLLLGSAMIIDAGVRADLWIESGRGQVSVDPRLRWTWLLGDHVDLHVGAGLAHQPPLFLIPLPGLERVSVADELQRVAQTDASAGITLPEDVRVEITGYLHRYRDAILNQNADYAISPLIADVRSYGGELLLRRDGRGWLSGWLSYTIGKSEATTPEGETFAPVFDIRHVLSLVTQLRIGDHLGIGARFHARSGQLVNQTPGALRPSGQEVRLPWFVRLDARAGYSWTPAWGAAQVYLEWINASLTSEPIGAECLLGQCRVIRGALISLPSIGFRATI